jgi:hypothetical protein
MQLLFFSETNLSDIYAFNWTYLTERQQGWATSTDTALQYSEAALHMQVKTNRIQRTMCRKW